MGKVINFNHPLNKHNATSSKSRFLAEEKTNTATSSFNEDDYFLAIIYQWPCFSDLPQEASLDALLDHYCTDKLTSAQECVLDLMLHLSDPEFIFDIGASLKHWGSEDRAFFLYYLECHSKMVDHFANKE